MTGRQSWVRSVILAAVCSALFTIAAAGQASSVKTTGHHEDHAAPGKAVDDNTVKPEKFVIPDVTVSDQNGKKLRFYSDLVKDKKVIVNFIYTSCDGICPTTGGRVAKLQEALGKRLGSDVFLITITTDPETDTPERMKAWGKKYNPAAGWTLVSGSPDNITRLLEIFTGDGKSTGYHVPAVCIVDDIKKSQKWTYALSPIEEILGMVDAR